MKTMLHVLLTIGLFVYTSSQAGTVRVSFLNDSGVLQETVELLKTNGCRDDGVTAFLAPQMTTNFSMLNLPVATARDAFNFSVPSWYGDASEGFIPRSMVDARISLTAALYSNHVLPASTSEDKLNDAVMKTLRANWARQAVTFPSRFEVVLCHAVFLPNHQFSTCHAGLLFIGKKRYTYVEKDSGNGPFVRLDFDIRADLMACRGKDTRLSGTSSGS